MANIEENKRLTLDFFAAMQRADADAIADAYADGGRVITMGNTLISGARDKSQIRQFAGGVLEAFPDGLEFTVHTLTAEGDRVAVEATSEGRHASGRDYCNHYHFLFTWRDGKLQELKEYMDTELVTDVICGGVRPPQVEQETT
jgi:ketosteroid isomerase-like protein